MRYDILAFGVHPDDLEIGIYGTLAKSVTEGKSILMIDLTAGEMGSNGSPEIRKAEAENAAKLIGVDRMCLGLPDRDIRVEKNQLDQIIRCIRLYQPEWILYPFEKDYHPDHENGSRLIREAIHSSGLIHYKLDNLEPYRPVKTAKYYINDVESPNLYVDISDVIDLKRRALEQHSSQFRRDISSRNTYLNDGFIEKVVSRDAYMGMICKKGYAEALHLITPPVVGTLGGKLE